MTKRRSIYILITSTFFSAAIFVIAAYLSVLIYRSIPLINVMNPSQSLFNRVTTGDSVRREIFATTSLLRTPLTRRNIFGFPIWIAIGIARKLIPPLNNFFRNRQSREIDPDNPNIADFELPSFNMDNFEEESEYAQNRQVSLNLRNVISAFIFLFIFMGCIFIITAFTSTFLKLIGSVGKQYLGLYQDVEKELAKKPETKKNQISAKKTKPLLTEKKKNKWIE